MNYLYAHLWHLFVALGGVGIAVGAVVKGVRPTIHWALQQLLNNPKYKPILIEYRSQIEAFFDAVDAQIKEDLDQAQ